jgi:predicted  nucleic acid-binding Zn-ribbon protein
MKQDTDKPHTTEKVKSINPAKAVKTKSTSTRKTERDQQALEINQQMSALETAIDKLNKKVNTTNRKIKTEVDRINTSDAEITDKVADTYRQMGVIDSSLTDLNKSSSKISADLKKVNTRIRGFEKQSAEALQQAVAHQTEVNDEFKAQHEDILERAEKLSKKATSITTKLNKSIRDHRKDLSELEARIIAELESVAEASQRRDFDLDGKIEGASKEIDSQKARMLIMQRVDKALEKRAASLEASTDRLIADSESLRQSTDALDVLTSKLATEVDALEQHTAQLAEQNAEQQGYIDALQDATDQQASSLVALGRTEQRHFSILGGVALLLLLAIVGLFLFDHYQRETDMTLQSKREAVTHEQVAKLQTRVTNEQITSRQTEQEIGALQQNIESIKQEMLGITDQVESLDGRVQYLAPLYSFGRDNTISGAHGLSGLNQDHFAIKIATVEQKQELYQVAQRYSGYLQKHDLAYFTDADGRYVLIYGADFESEEAVVSALQDLPRYINFQKIGIISNREVMSTLQ